MWQYQNTDELYHYGVIGMRWGHRKQRPISSFVRRFRRSANKRKQKADVSINTKNNVRNRVDNAVKNTVNYRQATNSQLERATKRLKLENDYLKEVNTNLGYKKKDASIGKKFVSAVLSSMLVPAAKTIGQKYFENAFSNVLLKDTSNATKQVTQQATKQAIKQANKQATKQAVKNVEVASKEVLLRQNDLGKIYINSMVLKKK